MWYSGRQAALVLHDAGISLRQARRVLDLGLAGEPLVTSGIHLYEVAAVEALASRPVLERAELGARFPDGLFVARRDVPAGAAHNDQLDAVRSGWFFGEWAGALLQVRLGARGSMPFVAAVAGFVVLGAELVMLHREDEDHLRLELAPPGAWFDALRETRLGLGPGGGSWWIADRWRPGPVGPWGT